MVSSSSEQRILEMPRREGVGGAPAPSSLRRLLVVAGLFPYPPTNGSSMRTWSILQSLRANGHILHLLCFGDTRDVSRHAGAIREVCETVEVIPHNLQRLSQAGDFASRFLALPSALPFAVRRFRSPAMRNRISAWVGQDQIDAVICEGVFPLINFPSELAKPLLIDSHNVEHMILQRYLGREPNLAKRSYAWLESRKLRQWERTACARADLVMVCSEVDLAAVKQLCPPARLLVVPNVVDVNHYRPHPRGDGARVLYTGGMDWYPNRDAVTFFCAQILPELRQLVRNVEFVVAGRSPTEEFRRQFANVSELRFTGTVADMREEIAKAAVCVVPLRIGSGTRLKILEAAAMAKPVVCTQLGAEGLDFVPDEEILLADEPTPFARAVADLLCDPPRSRSIGTAARKKVEQQYSFRTLRGVLREAMRNVEAGIPVADSRQVGRIPKKGASL